MSVIVTGASGQLGRLVIDQLLATVPASEVTAVVRDPAKASDLAARGVTLAVADYNSPESLDGLLQAGDRVLLISGNEFHRDRTAQHKVVLGAAAKAGVALFAYTSIIGSQTGPVTDDHRATEDAGGNAKRLTRTGPDPTRNRTLARPPLCPPWARQGR
jgi:NAD(P)H dehydrogenase (quinone)